MSSSYNKPRQGQNHLDAPLAQSPTKPTSILGAGIRSASPEWYKKQPQTSAHVTIEQDRQERSPYQPLAPNSIHKSGSQGQLERAVRQDPGPDINDTADQRAYAFLNDAVLIEDSKQYVESEEGSPAKDLRKSNAKFTSQPLRGVTSDDGYVWQARDAINTQELNEVRASRDIQRSQDRELNMREFEISKARSQERFSRSTAQPQRNFGGDMKPKTAKLIYDRNYSINWQAYLSQQKDKGVRRSHDAAQYSALHAMNTKFERQVLREPNPSSKVIHKSATTHHMNPIPRVTPVRYSPPRQSISPIRTIVHQAPPSMPVMQPPPMVDRSLTTKVENTAHEVFLLQGAGQKSEYAINQLTQRFDVFEMEIIKRVRETQKYSKGLNALLRENVMSDLAILIDEVQILQQQKQQVIETQTIVQDQSHLRELEERINVLFNRKPEHYIETQTIVQNDETLFRKLDDQIRSLQVNINSQDSELSRKFAHLENRISNIRVEMPPPQERIVEKHIQQSPTKVLHGQPGAPGQRGSIGPPGERGLQGPIGGHGPQGPKGDRGLHGLKGDAGGPGPRGESGGQGPRGESGLKGPKGDRGEAGLKGPKGDRGEQGPVGPPGKDIAIQEQSQSNLVSVLDEQMNTQFQQIQQIQMNLSQRDNEINDLRQMISNVQQVKQTSNVQVKETAVVQVEKVDYDKIYQQLDVKMVQMQQQMQVNISQQQIQSQSQSSVNMDAVYQRINEKMLSVQQQLSVNVQQQQQQQQNSQVQLQQPLQAPAPQVIVQDNTRFDSIFSKIDQLTSSIQQFELKFQSRDEHTEGRDGLMLKNNEDIQALYHASEQVIEQQNIIYQKLENLEYGLKQVQQQPVRQVENVSVNQEINYSHVETLIAKATLELQQQIQTVQRSPAPIIQQEVRQETTNSSHQLVQIQNELQKMIQTNTSLEQRFQKQFDEQNTKILQKVETKKSSAEKSMTNEVIVDQLNEFRQSLAHLEKTFERDDKYASIRQQIENMVVDIARKNKKLTENQDTQILHLNTEIGHLQVRLEDYKTTVSAVTSDLVTIQVETRQLSQEKRQEDISEFTTQLVECKHLVEQFKGSFDNKLNGIAQFQADDNKRQLIMIQKNREDVAGLVGKMEAQIKYVQETQRQATEVVTHTKVQRIDKEVERISEEFLKVQRQQFEMESHIKSTFQEHSQHLEEMTQFKKQVEYKHQEIEESVMTTTRSVTKQLSTFQEEQIDVMRKEVKTMTTQIEEVVAPVASSQSQKWESHIQTSEFIHSMHSKVEESHVKTEKMLHSVEQLSSERTHLESRMDKMQQDIINHLVGKKLSDPIQKMQKLEQDMKDHVKVTQSQIYRVEKLLTKKFEDAEYNNKINTSQGQEIQILKNEVRKMVGKIGGIDSGYASMGKPEAARTLGSPSQIQRLSPGKDKTIKYDKSESYEDDFEKDSKEGALFDDY